MNHSVDPKETLTKELGDLNDIQVFNNQLLVAVYIRPSVTKSGIHLPGQVTEEDKHQGKVGLVIKMGKQAFVDPDNKWFDGTDIKVGDWVYFRVSDGWSINVHGVPCRMIDDTDVRGATKYPDAVW
jgi:co-chaperonin GroES (HSP10)